MGLGMGLGEQQGKRVENGGVQEKEKEVEVSEKKSSFGRLEEVRVDTSSALPRVCIVGTGIFGRQGPQYISEAILDHVE